MKTISVEWLLDGPAVSFVDIISHSVAREMAVSHHQALFPQLPIQKTV